MRIADWDSDLPSDDWLRGKQIDDLRDWILARAAGHDGRWNWRQGEPLDLLYTLLDSRATDIQDRLVRAIAGVLRQLILKSGRHLSDEAALSVIDLAAAGGSKASGADAERIADALTSLLENTDSSASAEYLSRLLRARALVPPRPPLQLWNEYLDGPSRSVAVAAFQGLRQAESVEAAKEAFPRLLYLMPNDPDLTAPAMDLQDSLGDAGFEGYLRGVEALHPSLADAVRALARKLGVALPVTAFSVVPGGGGETIARGGDIVAEPLPSPIAAFNTYTGAAE